MASLEQYIDDRLANGRICFSREEGQAALGLSTQAFAAAARRLAKKQRLVSPHRGFYVIVRPEDRVVGAPEPAHWVDPLMSYLALDYRVSLLCAAAFHGASHQAVMVFQVIAPKQLRSMEIGRHRLQFIYQTPNTFAQSNRAKWLAQMKTEAGFAQVASVELTLFDCVRYFHKAGGIDGAAQVAKDIGAHASPRRLVGVAAVFEHSVARRLGYLLEHSGHARQARALEPIAKRAKSLKALDPSVRLISRSLGATGEQNSKWMLWINTSVEVDS